jgi:hypothetical protein
MSVSVIGKGKNINDSKGINKKSLMVKYSDLYNINPAGSLFDFHVQQVLSFNKSFQYITNHTFTNTRRRSGKNEIANVQ